MTCGRKVIRRGVLDAAADCKDCEWKACSRNALALAARHHDRTGHQVSAHETWGVTYATPDVLEQIEQAAKG